VSIRVHRLTDLKHDTILTLQRRLVDYYSKPPDIYYLISNRSAEQYTPAIQPFHCNLISYVRPGTSVLELGCGSAHLCPFVEAAGGHYTGGDHSYKLLENNRQRFPRADFFRIGSELQKQFDIVASLYTIEHVVDPKDYLETMWNFCKPGGSIAIICPEFVESPDFPPSFYYGKTVRRFREKVKSLSSLDACCHLLDVFWFARRWKRRAQSSLPGAFWINMRPRIFAGAEYSIDADAVHLPGLKDLVWWLERRGTTIVTTFVTMPNIDASVLRYNCYVLAHKPVF
jgi:SAM-dependent methyltransferase